MLRMDDGSISSPRIRNPAVSSRITSAVPVNSAVKKRGSLLLLIAAAPAAAAQMKLLAELRYPSACSPMPVVAANNAVRQSIMSAHMHQAAIALTRKPASGRICFSFDNENTPEQIRYSHLICSGVKRFS